MTRIPLLPDTNSIEIKHLNMMKATPYLEKKPH